MNYNEKVRLVSCMLDLGEILLTSGAEVNRIEDTITRIGLAYDFVRVDVFTITSSIVLTISTLEEEVITQTRRITRYDTDMDKIDKVNSLSRRICENPPDIKFLSDQIAMIRQENKYPQIAYFFIYAVVSAAFSIFFGGSGLDAVAAFLSGIVMRLVLLIGARMKMQNIILNIICSAIVGATAVFLTSIGIGQSLDKIIIGNIMLLIPGLSLTSSLRDIISGHTITGLLGMCEAVLKAVAVAMGFALIILGIGS